MQGLTSSEARALLKSIGPNVIPQNKVSFYQKIVSRLFTPISLMLIAAAVLSFVDGKIFDFYFILILLVLNQGVTFWQEQKADNAIEKLNKNLATKIETLRDGKWYFISSDLLVPGDYIKVATGGVIPADGKLSEAKNVTVNQAALTGESLPQDKKIGDIVYSGSYLTTGMAIIEVIATGRKTYFGKTIFTVIRDRGRSILEQDIIRISKFLSILSIIAVLILNTLFIFSHTSLLELLTLDLSLMIAGIPVSLPTVMTLIIEFGVLELAKKNVIVRKLAALEDLANVNLLLTDKTGTLTKNQINVQKVQAYGKYQDSDVVLFAEVASLTDPRNLINQAILGKGKELQIKTTDFKITDFTPADSNRKRITVEAESTQEKMMISLGAPQIIASFCQINPKITKQFETDVEELAQNGFRAIAVALNKEKTREQNMDLVGLISLSDNLREDAADVIEFLQESGIQVVMLTGDNRAIGQQMAKKLNLGGEIVTGNELHNMKERLNVELFNDTGAFVEIMPEDKLELVQLGRKKFIVGVTGDGVNDLPAMKAANVGIAVQNAVDALKSTADIVLLSNGISIIKDAIIESRKIFSRVYAYSVYRMSESFRLIITIVVLGAIYKAYPLTPLQLIILALLNDIPIISLAFDRVKIASRPAKINVQERTVLSSLYGLVGVANSLILFFLLTKIFSVDWSVIQTIYFLKLTVSGHMLIYVARTNQKWYKFLPSKEVIVATTGTQLLATFFAVTGLFMTSSISLWQALLVWGWCLIWMQVAEVIKNLFYSKNVLNILKIDSGNMSQMTEQVA